MLNDLEWCLTLAALEVESWEVEKLLKSNKSKVWKHGSCLFSDLLLKPSETLRWLLVYSKETWLAESKKIIKNRLILMRLQRWHTSFFSKIQQTTTGWYLPKLCVVICLAPQEAPLHRWSGRKGPEARKKWTKNHRTHTRIVQRSTKNRDHVITNHILSNEPENIIDHPVLSVLHLCDRFLVGSLSWCTQSSSGSTTKKPKETTCRGYPEQRSSAAFNSNKKNIWHILTQVSRKLTNKSTQFV